MNRRATPLKPSHAVRYVLLVGALALGCGADAPSADDFLDAAPEGAVELLARLRSAYDQERYTDATAIADTLIGLAPDLPAAHYYRGLVLMTLYDLDAADREFDRVVSLDRFHRGGWYQRGHVSFEKGQYRDAIRRYQRQREVVVSSPRNLKDYYRHVDELTLQQTWLQVGRAYQQMHVADSAMRAYMFVLDLDSTHAQANSWVSELYEEQGDDEMAVRYAARALTVEPQNPEFAYRFGLFLVRRGETAEALRIFQYVAAVQPWNAGVHYNLGRTLIALGRNEEGEAHLRRTEYLQALNQEIEHARAAATQYPDDPARWRAISRLLGAAGRVREQQEVLAVARAVSQRVSTATNDSTES